MDETLRRLARHYAGTLGLLYLSTWAGSARAIEVSVLGGTNRLTKNDLLEADEGVGTEGMLRASAHVNKDETIAFGLFALGKDFDIASTTETSQLTMEREGGYQGALA